LLVFNYLVGNADCHGKNFSLLYGPDGLRLAPAYDLMSTAIYPNIQKKTAMKIGGEYAPELIFRRHWHKLVLDTATARKALDREINEIASAVQVKASELSTELRARGITSTVFDDIGRIIERRMQQIMFEP
jgi:serine/threonine-protein kinase HipA